MDHRTTRRHAVAALGLAALALLAACGQADPSTETPAGSPPASAAPPQVTGTQSAGTPPAGAEPTGSQPAGTQAPPIPTDACLGIVTYTIDGADSADVPKGLCLRVGARLRIENTFPNATANPPGRATCVYEAGIVNCLLTDPGNVTITWGQGAEQRSTTITIVS
jgi:hypothetical protein